jgi:hypothetical protein
MVVFPSASSTAHLELSRSVGAIRVHRLRGCGRDRIGSVTPRIVGFAYVPIVIVSLRPEQRNALNRHLVAKVV